MRLVSYATREAGQDLVPGVVVDGAVYDVNELLGSGDALLSATALLEKFGADWSAFGADLVRRVAETPAAERGALANVTLGPPVPHPSKFLCVGLNYRAHVEETGRKYPAHPDIFSKFDTSLVGPDQDIALSEISDNVDYEGELAIVIGKTARNVDARDALDHVAGVTIVNDISLRDLQWRGTQWLPGKAVDDSTPAGPALVSLDEIPDLGDLAVTTRVNGQVVQKSTTERMIFDVATIVSYISYFIELRPGDLIATGTPDGIGAKRKPPVWLRPGDDVEVEIEHVGVLRNHVA